MLSSTVGTPSKISTNDFFELKRRGTFKMVVTLLTGVSFSKSLVISFKFFFTPSDRRYSLGLNAIKRNSDDLYLLFSNWKYFKSLSFSKIKVSEEASIFKLIAEKKKVTVKTNINKIIILENLKIIFL